MLAQIAFYQLQSRSVQDVLPSLLQKTRDVGKLAEIIAPEAIHNDLSQAIWTAQPDSWLPHGIVSRDDDPDRSGCPIWIMTEATEAIGASASGASDSEPFRFYIDGLLPPTDANSNGMSGRIFIIFDGYNDVNLRAAREAWKIWRQTDHELSYFEQDDEKGWVKKF